MMFSVEFWKRNDATTFLLQQNVSRLVVSEFNLVSLTHVTAQAFVAAVQTYCFAK